MSTFRTSLVTVPTLGKVVAETLEAAEPGTGVRTLDAYDVAAGNEGEALNRSFRSGRLSCQTLGGKKAPSFGALLDMANNLKV